MTQDHEAALYVEMDSDFGSKLSAGECECDWLFIFLYGPAMYIQLVQSVTPPSPLPAGTTFQP